MSDPKEKAKVKRWVVNHASVTKPYGDDWSVSVTIGYDYNETADTIEKAYCNLADRIFESNYIFEQLSKFQSYER